MENLIYILWQLLQIGFLIIGVIVLYMFIYAIIAGFYQVFTAKD